MLQRAHGRLVVLAAAAALASLIGFLVVATATGIGGPELGVVEAPFTQAPDFTLPRLSVEDGTVGTERIALRELADGPVFLYFWASWCAPCEREAPLIQRLWEQEYREAGYAFVAINILDAPGPAAEFVRRHALTFPVLIDDTREVYIEYGVDGVPEAFFLRPGQQVDRRFLGELRESEFRTMLGRLIAD